jgi:hypothetical protein
VENFEFLSLSLRAIVFTSLVLTRFRTNPPNSLSIYAKKKKKISTFQYIHSTEIVENFEGLSLSLFPFLHLLVSQSVCHTRTNGFDFSVPSIGFSQCLIIYRCLKLLRFWSRRFLSLSLSPLHLLVSQSVCHTRTNGFDFIPSIGFSQCLIIYRSMSVGWRY